jgi:hypothetical protein
MVVVRLFKVDRSCVPFSEAANVLDKTPYNCVPARKITSARPTTAKALAAAERSAIMVNGVARRNEWKSIAVPYEAPHELIWELLPLLNVYELPL